MFWKKRTLGQAMAFGRIPAYCRYELYMERYRSLAALAQSSLQPFANLAVLDIGSGRGRLKYFFDDGVVREWHGIEILDEMIGICAGLGYQMHKLDIDSEPLPFPDARFDLVVGLHVLEHLDNPQRALGEMVRVLRPGGLLALGVPTKPPGIAELIDHHYLRRQQRNFRKGRTSRAFSAGSFRRFLGGILGDACELLDLRGFRLFSARKVFPLEDLKAFYTVSTWIGRTCPSLTPEVNIVFRKRAVGRESGGGAP